MNTSQVSLYPTFLLALCAWREARGETAEAQRGVIHSILNRVARPSWWGRDIVSVILKPEQYSSFNPGDPNSVKFPASVSDPIWLAIVEMAFAPGPDNTAGATNYLDSSMWNDPPEWTKAMTPTVQLDGLRFWKA